MIKENIQKVESGNAVLVVKIYPKENAESIILLHGGPGMPDEMQELVEILEKKYQIINFEQRGVGDSVCRGCKYSMEEYISDIDAIAKKFNLKSFHLFGYSWGGLYAQIYVEKKSEKIKSLFLASPGSGTNTDWEKTKKEVFKYNKDRVFGFNRVRMIINLFLGLLGSDKAYRSLYKQVAENYNKGYGGSGLSEEILEKIKAELINKTAKQISKYPMLKKTENPNFPIIITYGDNDIYGESKSSIYKRFPTAEFIEIKNSSHFLWKNNLHDFEKVLNKFYKIN